ncbi:MAG TPA: DUF1566 domain-containing protein [Caldimonas sp.]|nr:DUF1566 domain-containing protein [Caldimonas sp.]HEX2542444.1 DUF1566 domain-containing protein [Caldimonas sp.]
MTLSRAALPRLRFAAIALLALAAGASHGQGRFTISADGQEVRDSAAGLTWRRCSEGMRWDGKACSGKLLKYSYAGAKEKATRTARDEGKAWRIPTREELVALVDMKQKKKPRIDTQAFPQTPGALYWASRTGSTDNLNVWLVNFSNGKVRPSIGQSKFPLRLVRTSS